MECPICKSIFPKFKEVLIIVNRSFTCHHCRGQLISYPDEKGNWIIEEDFAGEKWKKAIKTAFSARS